MEAYALYQHKDLNKRGLSLERMQDEGIFPVIMILASIIIPPRYSDTYAVRSRNCQYVRERETVCKSGYRIYIPETISILDLRYCCLRLKLPVLYSFPP